MVLCLAIGTVFNAYTQHIKVVDEDSKRPIFGATVSNSDFSFTTTTNGMGMFSMPALNNSDTLTFRSLGHETLSLTVADIRSLPDSTITMRTDHFSLNDVVITANRWEQPEKEVPQTSIHVRPQQIAEDNPQTSADLLAKTGAVFVQKSQQGGGSPMIRGFATNRVLISVDQVRMNNAIFRSGNLQNVISIDPLAVEQVEVLFGPGSLLYGSDAIGGVMSFNTLAPVYTSGGFQTNGTAVIRRSTANKEYTQHFDTKLSHKKWALVSSITLNQFGDLKMGSRGPDDYLKRDEVFSSYGSDQIRPNPDQRIQLRSGYSQLNLMEKLGFKPNANTELVYAFHHSATSNVDRYDRLLRRRDGLPRSAEWYYGPQVWTMHHGKLNFSKKTQLYDALSINAAFQKFEESRYDRDFQSDLLNIRQERVNAYSLNLDFNKAFNARHRMVYGAEYVLNNVNSTGLVQNIKDFSRSTGPSRYPDAVWQSAGAYANYLYQVSPQFHWEAGLRYSQFLVQADFNTDFYPLPFDEANLSNGALTGSTGLVWSPSTELKLSSHFSTGFRAPNVDDIGKVFDSEPGAVVVPNPELKPEHVYNLDLGMAWIWRKNLRLNASLFYSLLDDALVRRSFQLNGMDSIFYDGELSKVQAIQNSAQAYVYGALLSVEYRSPFGLSATSTFSYQYGEEEVEENVFYRLRHAAPWFGQSSVSYQLRAFNFEVYAQYNGGLSPDQLPLEEHSKEYLYALNEEGQPYLPSWITYNTRISFQSGSGIFLVAAIENLSNLRYRPYSSGLVAAGRNLVLSARVSF